MTPMQEPEKVINAIILSIKDNLSTVLTSLRSEYNDPSVPTPLPRSDSYYIAYDYSANVMPAIYVVANSIDFQLGTKEANHINSKIDTTVTLMAEAKTSKEVTKQIYRYQAALHAILNQRTFELGTSLKFVTTVERVNFRPTLTSDQVKDLFRKEVALELSVYCYENF
jgi:hypothetical protein